MLRRPDARRGALRRDAALGDEVPRPQLTDGDEALERRLVDVGGPCDCGILSHGYRLARHLLVRDLATDELEPPDERPVCAGVGRTSTKPCANWQRRPKAP